MHPTTPLLAPRWVFVVLAAALMVATVFDGATHHGPALLLRLLVAIGAVALWPRDQISVRYRDWYAPALAIVAVGPALIVTEDFGAGLQTLIRVVMVVLLFTALLASPRDHTVSLLWVFGAVGMVHAVWAAVELALVAPRGSGGFFNPNDLAAFLVPLSILSLHRAVRGDHHGWWWATALLTAGVFSTLSRSGALAWFAGAVVCVVMQRKTIRMGRRGVALLLAFVIAAGIVAYQRAAVTRDAFEYARVALYTRSAQVALAHPFGVGLGSYGEVMRREGVPLDGWVRYPKRAERADSELLHAWVEAGWLGLLAALFPLWILGRALRHMDPRERPGWVGALIALVIPAALSSTLHVPPVAYLGAIIGAHIVRADGSNGSRLLRIPPRAGRLGAATAGGIAVLLALPALAGSIMMTRAADARAGGDLEAAQGWADRAAGAMPWSVGAAMMSESLRFLRGTPPLEASERLAELAERFPTAPAPPARAAWLVEELARNEPHPSLHALAAALRTEAAARDPLNTTRWIELADARALAGDPVGSEAALQRAVTVEPHFATAHARLAIAAGAAGRSKDASAHAESAWRAHAEGARHGEYGRHVLFLDPEMRTMLMSAGLGPP